MQHVEVERFFPHPVEQVFRRYTDHVGWSEWAGLGKVRLTREGSPDKNGVGAVRAFSTALGLREQVTRFEPPLGVAAGEPHAPSASSAARMEYRICQGALPLADHNGEVLFTPQGSGTRMNWRVSFRCPIPGLGWPIERGLGVLFRRILARLARDLAR